MLTAFVVVGMWIFFFSVASLVGFALHESTVESIGECE